MSKKTVLWILLDLVFLIVFNVVLFVTTGTQKPVSVWISYGFIHFAYIMLLATPLLTRKGSCATVFGVSLYAISAVYFLMAFITGIGFILLSSENYKLSLLVQVVIAGLYAIILLPNLIANEHTAGSMERREAELQYVKRSSTMLKDIMEMTEDEALKKKIEKAYDLLRFSQSQSNNMVRNYETTVMDLIEVLENNVVREDAAAAHTTLDKIIKNANERNRRLKS